MTTTITGKLPAYTYGAGAISAEIIQLTAEGSQEQKDLLLSNLTMTVCDWIKESSDYVPAGTVEITFTPASADEMARAQVEALQAKRKEVLASAQREADMIQEMISRLQALTFEMGSVS